MWLLFDATTPGGIGSFLLRCPQRSPPRQSASLSQSPSPAPHAFVGLHPLSPRYFDLYVRVVVKVVKVVVVKVVEVVVVTATPRHNPANLKSAALPKSWVLKTQNGNDAEPHAVEQMQPFG